MTPFRIAVWGAYRPRTNRPSTDLDVAFGQASGWAEREFGVRTRGVADPDETSSMMGAAAAQAALDQAGWCRGGFDVLIGACGVMEQPIPSTSMLIQRRLGLGATGIPCFDVNQTCLSFLSALDVAAMGISAGRWRRVLIVSSDIPSAGLDLSVPKTASIFGDGAAAIAIEATDDPSGPGLLSISFATYGDGSDLASLRSGGTRMRTDDVDALIAGSKFRMDAFGIFKAAVRHLPRIVDEALANGGLDRTSVGHVVCHQASKPGVEYVRRLFEPNPDRVVDIFPFTGNQIATSIPTVLVHALENGIARPGDTVVLLGTAAGVSVGAAVLRL